MGRQCGAGAGWIQHRGQPAVQPRGTRSRGGLDLVNQTHHRNRRLPREQRVHHGACLQKWRPPSVLSTYVYIFSIDASAVWVYLKKQYNIYFMWLSCRDVVSEVDRKEIKQRKVGRYVPSESETLGSGAKKVVTEMFRIKKFTCIT